MADTSTLTAVKGKQGTDWLFWRGRLRRTGTWVSIYDRSQPANYIPGDGRWAVVCEDHGTNTSTDDFNDANRNIYYHPESFCEACREQQATGAPVATPARQPRAPHPAPTAAPRAPVVRKVVVTEQPTIDEDAAWQTWAMKLADMAPKGKDILWCGDYHYAVIISHGRSVDAYVKDADTAVYKADGVEYPTFEEAYAAAAKG